MSTSEECAENPRRVLVVEDSDACALLVRRVLAGASTPFEVEHEPRLDRALRRLEDGRFDAMVLDLGLPDGQGAATIGSACTIANHLPVVVLTGTDDEDLALAALRAGAQDYLVKDRLDYRALPTTILRAIERHRRTQRALEASAKRAAEAGPVKLRDELTGLVSEAVLMDRLQHAIDRAARRGGPVAVASLRYESLVEVRELLGRELGDALLRDAAARLQAQVRRSDTLAIHSVLGFVLVLEDATTPKDTDRLFGALTDALASLQVVRPGIQLDGLAPSIGTAAYPQDGCTPEDLLAAVEVDRRLREGGDATHQTVVR